jgi:hypothetical protein
VSRRIDIGYRPESGGALTPVEVQAPYYLLGTQRLSMEFWSRPRLGEMGLTRLTDLGVTDPVYFVGWDDLAELRREIALLQHHLRSIAFHPEPLAGCRIWSTATACCRWSPRRGASRSCVSGSVLSVSAEAEPSNAADRGGIRCFRRPTPRAPADAELCH